MKNKEKLLKTIDALIKELKNLDLSADKYMGWRASVIEEKIPKSMEAFLDAQIAYWGPKDREYVKYLKMLLNEGKVEERRGP